MRIHTHTHTHTPPHNTYTHTHTHTTHLSTERARRHRLSFADFNEEGEGPSKHAVTAVAEQGGQAVDEVFDHVRALAADA